MELAEYQEKLANVDKGLSMLKKLKELTANHMISKERNTSKKISQESRDANEN